MTALAAVPKVDSASGASFPVLFVHGFTGTSDPWKETASISWSAPPPTGGAKSFVDWVSTIPGALPVLFDYRKTSLKWVDDETISGALANAIACLAAHSGQQVAVVAHSMGGLATRQALSVGETAAHVSLVVTIGTPNLGSFWPYALADMAVTADVINRWAETSALLSGPRLDQTALLEGYKYAQKVADNCAQMISDSPSSGACGEITPLVGALKSRAGVALAAGSEDLAKLPPWPKGVKVHAISSKYTGLGADKVLGDGIVFPASSVAGAGGFSATSCNLTAPIWERQLQQVLTPDGCLHTTQVRNQNLVPLALSQLRADIATRDRPITSLDWRNAEYKLSCGGIAPKPFTVTVRNGHGTGAADEKYGNGYLVSVGGVTSGDLTGDGRPEVAVLLSCTGQPSNFSMDDVLVFSDGAKLLGWLPTLKPLPTGNPIPPQYEPKELGVDSGQLVIGVRYYAKDDSHADRPSIHRRETWRWTGQQFARSGSTDVAPVKLEQYPLTLDGMGPLRVGMTEEEVEVALDRKLTVPYLTGTDCGIASLEGSSSGIQLMFLNGKFVRIEVMGASRVKTLSGIRIGNSEADVKRAYAKNLTVEPHRYNPTGHYLVYTPASAEDADRLLVFETNGSVVTSFRAGEREAAQLVEGCL